LNKGKNYYDFFPYQHSYLSFTLLQDKHRLTNLEFLAVEPDFHLNQDHSYRDQIKAEDRILLQKLVAKYKRSSEDALYASLLHVLQTQVPERNNVQITNLPALQTPHLFTIGYEGISIDAYINTLLAHHIAALVDIRKNPISRKFGFSKQQLINETKAFGIQYIHLPDLGIESSLRKDLSDYQAYSQLFDYYSQHILPKQKKSLERLKQIISEYSQVALTCFEADPHCCHRHKVTEYLSQDPNFFVPVVHITNKDIQTKPLVDKSNIPSRIVKQIKNGVYYIS